MVSSLIKGMVICNTLYSKCFDRDTCLDREVRGCGKLSLMKSEKALEEETFSSSLDLEKGANVLKEIMGKITERLNSKMNFGK